MSPETLAILKQMRPRKYVWCQHGKAIAGRNDEHQVCLDQEAAHYARGGTSWGCTCKCHNG